MKGSGTKQLSDLHSVRLLKYAFASLALASARTEFSNTLIAAGSYISSTTIV